MNYKKILMIGNSFSICVGKNLPQMVASVPGNLLKLTSLYIGGCSLERHWSNVEADLAAASPMERPKPYRVNTWYSGVVGPVSELPGCMTDYLDADNWDIITIQQASPLSWDPETYQPFADKLIAYVRKHCPSSEIVIQQTWAYRADDPRITTVAEPEWGFHQETMHQKLTANYTNLAKKYGFRIIPMGNAVKLARENEAHSFRVPTPEELAKFTWPDFPPQASDPVGKYFWGRNKNDPEFKLRCDYIHLNIRGEYLQAAVWFKTLFEQPATAITYNHPELPESDCEFLRNIAQQATI